MWHVMAIWIWDQPIFMSVSPQLRKLKWQNPEILCIDCLDILPSYGTPEWPSQHLMKLYQILKLSRRWRVVSRTWMWLEVAHILLTADRMDRLQGKLMRRLTHIFTWNSFPVLKYCHPGRSEYVERLLKLESKASSLCARDYTITGIGKPHVAKKLDRPNFINFTNVPLVCRRSTSLTTPHLSGLISSLWHWDQYCQCWQADHPYVEPGWVDRRLQEIPIMAVGSCLPLVYHLVCPRLAMTLGDWHHAFPSVWHVCLFKCLWAQMLCGTLGLHEHGNTQEEF